MASKSRAELVKILETASDISVEACDIILKACGGSAIMGHGSILWALMDTEGTPATISGFKLFVYLQYYFCAQVFTKNKLAIARPLTDTELAYLVAAAAFGLQEGCVKFDDAYAAGDISSIHSLKITEKQFLDFFYSASIPFNFATIVSHVQQIREFWSSHKTAFVGFISPEVTAYTLRQQGIGSFVLRFNSSGTISAVVLDAASEIQSHPLLDTVVSSSLNLIALIQRSTTLQKFAQISETAALPKAEVLEILKKAANATDKAIESEIERQKKATNAQTASAAPKVVATPQAAVAAVAAAPIVQTPAATPIAKPTAVATQPAVPNPTPAPVAAPTATPAAPEAKKTTAASDVKAPEEPKPAVKAKKMTEEKSSKKKKEESDSEESDEEDEEDDEDFDGSDGSGEEDDENDDEDDGSDGEGSDEDEDGSDEED